MRKEFVNELGRIQRVKRIDFIAKDIILHQMLLDLSRNEFFTENFVFKGGACLIKCHLGYFRFSEDVDFSWKHHEVLKASRRKRFADTFHIP